MDPSSADLGPSDQAFARFAQTGDSRALALVFDETAPELLRVASHLVSDLDLAEDLVQTTFLAAIESRRDYDSARAVLPWLIGILINRARDLHKASRRKPDSRHLSPSIPGNPEREATAAEFSEAISNAIANLPEPYRPVLLMHLRHSQPVQEIALVLGRAPGTVRKQLSRGMELLRRVLPAGFATTVSGAILPGQGLTAMREIVLSAGSSAAPASVGGAVIPTAIIGGLILMKKTLITATALLTVASLAYLAWPDTRSGDQTPSSSGQSPSMQARLEESSRNLAPEAGTERVEIDPAIQFEEPSEETLNRTLVARVVNAAGHPLPGATVGLTVTRNRSGGPRLARFQLPPTDEEGITRQENVQYLSEGRVEAFELAVHLFGGIGKPTSVVVEDLTDEPVDVVAPPFGSVEIALLGPQGQPWKSPVGTELEAMIHTVGEEFADGRTTKNAMRLGLDGRGIAEPVVLGREFRALVYSVVATNFRGPTNAGERVVVEVNMPGDTPVLVGRILDLSGTPVSGSHRLDFVADRLSGSQHIGVDRAGRFRVPLAVNYLGSTPTVTFALRGTSGEATDQMVRVIARAPLVAGPNDLGDLVLSQAPILVAGRVEWVDGTPVELSGPVVRVERTQTDRGPVGPVIQLAPIRIDGPKSWNMASALQPEFLGSGRFVVRGLVGEGGYRIRLEGDFVPVEPVEFVPGARDLLFRVEKGGSLMASFLTDTSTPWGSLEYRLESMEEAGKDDSYSRYIRESGQLKTPYLSPEQLVCHWRPLKPGPYRLTIRCPGIEESLVDFQGLLVPSGGAANDPRLSGIDLRGLVRGFTVTVMDPTGEPVRAPLWGAVIVKGSYDARTAWLGYGLYGPDGKVQVLSTGPVDLLVAIPRFLNREVPGVFADTAVTLEQAPEIEFRLGRPTAEIPSGVQFQLDLGALGSSRDRSVGVTIQNDEGRFTARGPLDHVLGRSVERLMLDDDYAAVFYPREPGRRNLQLTLSRRVEGQTRSETVTLQPDSVDLGDAVDGQLIEVRVDPEDLIRALASLSR